MAADAHEAQTLSIWVNRPQAEAYAFLAEPTNFPKWASGLCSAIDKRDGAWIAETSHGQMVVRFTVPNSFGVLDHHVQPASGPEIHVPMRALPHGTGTEIMLTLFRQPEMSDEQFQQDIGWVKRDLQTLKALLEQ